MRRSNTFVKLATRAGAEFEFIEQVGTAFAVPLLNGDDPVALVNVLQEIHDRGSVGEQPAQHLMRREASGPRRRVARLDLKLDYIITHATRPTKPVASH